jgi:hypothetical protein
MLYRLRTIGPLMQQGSTDIRLTGKRIC